MRIKTEECRIYKYEAFTLIEILVVVGLIAILAAITIVAINPARMFSDSRNVERWNGLRAISNGIEQLVIDSNGATTILDGDGSAIGDCESASSAIMDQPTAADAQVDMDGYLVDNYVVSVPRDPSTASGAYTGYRICRFSNSTRYLVFAPGAELDEIIELPTTGEYAILGDSLVAYWKLNEALWNGTADEVIDETVYSNDGVRVGNATTAAGKFSNGGTFDGSGDYVNFGDQAAFDFSTPFTISLWMKLNEIPSVAGHDYALITKYTGAPNRQWVLEIGTNDDLYFWVSYNGTNGQYLVNDYIVTAADVDTWRHVVVSVEADGASRLYVDGTVIKNGTLNNTTVANTGAPLQIGRRNNSPYNYLDGMLDDVRLYDKALTQTEVQLLYEFIPND